MEFNWIYQLLYYTLRLYNINKIPSLFLLVLTALLSNVENCYIINLFSICSSFPVEGPEMTEVEPVLDFASSGRSGRRNALPDILGSPAGVNPGDLPLKLAELTVEGTI